MREAGYVTLSADDSCSRSPLNVGDPAYDFFDTYAPTFARGPESCTEEVFCRHSELLDYAAQWMDIHADTPHLAYLHLDGTHGTRPESMVRYDADIASWIRGRLHGPGAADTAIIIMSDHGVQAGDGHLTSQPFLATWLPQRLLRALGSDGISALRGNAERLLTPYDVHFTVQQFFRVGLASAQAKTKVLAATRQPLEASPTPGHVVRSALFPLPPARSCDDAGLPGERCFCAGGETSWQHFGGTAEDLEALGVSLVDLVNTRARQNLLGANFDLSICLLQLLDSVEAVRAKADGSSLEIIVATKPSGLFWKGIAYLTLGTYKVLSVEQITRYFPHEHCTPAGVDPKFCACNTKVVHRLATHERFWQRWPAWQG